MARAMKLPTFKAGGATLLKQLTLVIEDGVIEHVFYPVFPPDRNASDVTEWLSRRRFRLSHNLSEAFRGREGHDGPTCPNRLLSPHERPARLERFQRP